MADEGYYELRLARSGREAGIGFGGGGIQRLLNRDVLDQNRLQVVDECRVAKVAFGAARPAGGLSKGSGALRQQGSGYRAVGGALLCGESGHHHLRGRHGQSGEYEKLHRLVGGTFGSRFAGRSAGDFGAGPESDLDGGVSGE